MQFHKTKRDIEPRHISDLNWDTLETHTLCMYTGVHLMQYSNSSLRGVVTTAELQCFKIVVYL